MPPFQPAIDVLSPAVADYAVAHTTPADPHRAMVAEHSLATLPASWMLTGLIEGRLLEMLVFALQPRLVIDVGTYSGYSALSMAAVLPDGGRVITCERSSRMTEVAQRNIDASPYKHRIELRHGPALDTLSALPGPFDLVFIDADKDNYWNYYEASLEKLSPHGLIAVDNTLWGAKVAGGARTRNDGGPEDEALTAIVRDFNDRVIADHRTTSVMLTVRDGVTLIRRA
jgi:caffeoyl-CoA O-methyltransferase